MDGRAARLHAGLSRRIHSTVAARPSSSGDPHDVGEQRTQTCAVGLRIPDVAHPNEQSRPGYLKLGWREVGRPPVSARAARPRDLVTIARSRVPAELWSLPIDVGSGIAPWLDGRGSWPPPVPVSSTDRSLRTATDERFARWRYGFPDLHYRVVDGGDAAIVVRLRCRGASRELVVADRLGDPDRADALAVDTLGRVGATHALRMGPARPGRGFVPVPGGGPVLTWRAVCDHGPPPLPNWDLCLGDLELL